MEQKSRVDWVDTAKGICIIFVVMLHSVTGVEIEVGATGWMHLIVEFAKPFRMPDFFMISGLFLANVIDRDWKLYLDRKVVHFAYFYVLWVAIQFLFKAPYFAAESGWPSVPVDYLLSFIQPFGTVWFIYLLPVFFIVAKLAHERGVPKLAMLAVAALLQIAPVNTGSVIIDEFASRFVFFYAGYMFAPMIFTLAAWARQHFVKSFGILGIWALVNGGLVALDWAHLPIIALALGAAGAIAIILISTLITETGRLGFLRHFGENSIVIYLAFFFPMGLTRVILIEFGLLDPNISAPAITVIAVVSPMILFWMIGKTGIGWFLFRRPGWAYLNGAGLKRGSAQPAE